MKSELMVRQTKAIANFPKNPENEGVSQNINACSGGKFDSARTSRALVFNLGPDRMSQFDGIMSVFSAVTSFIITFVS